jgi:hypothetical protein
MRLFGNPGEEFDMARCVRDRRHATIARMTKSAAFSALSIPQYRTSPYALDCRGGRCECSYSDDASIRMIHYRFSSSQPHLRKP